MEELKLENEYQIRLRDMSFGERLKEVSEKHAQEVESLKITTSILRGEKDKEEAHHDDEAEELRVSHANELHVNIFSIFRCLRCLIHCIHSLSYSILLGSRDQIQH